MRGLIDKLQALEEQGIDNNDWFIKDGEYDANFPQDSSVLYQVENTAPTEGIAEYSMTGEEGKETGENPEQSAGTEEVQRTNKTSASKKNMIVNLLKLLPTQVMAVSRTTTIWKPGALTTL